MKTCTVCKTDKPIDHYHNNKRTKDGKSYRCKDCDREARRGWSERNPERSKQSSRERMLKHKYGIDLDDYDRLLTDQGGVCAICKCGPDSPRVAGSFAVDHCHITGGVRGLLCNQCNRAIGMMDDDMFIVATAADYLQTYEETH